MAAIDTGSLVGAAIDSVEHGLGEVAVPALIVAGAVTALTFGWRFARSLLISSLERDGLMAANRETRY